MAAAEAHSLTVDRQRRTTIPRDVLEAAGIPAGSTLMARAEAPGRIVLESPAQLLAQLQQWIAEGPTGDPSASRPSMAEELLAERAAEAAAGGGAESDEARGHGSSGAGPA